MIVVHAAALGCFFSNARPRLLFSVLMFLLVGSLISTAAEARTSYARSGVAYAHSARQPLNASQPKSLRFAGAPSRRWARVRAWRAFPSARLQAALRAHAPVVQADAAGRYGSVIAEASRYLGAGNVTGARGAWCADYVSMVLRRTGHRPLANRTVSSALAYAPRVSRPSPGDLVILNTRGGYAQHVGFFAGWDHGRVLIVSGNWGHRVARASVARGAVAAFVRV